MVRFFGHLIPAALCGAMLIFASPLAASADTADRPSSDAVRYVQIAQASHDGTASADNSHAGEAAGEAEDGHGNGHGDGAHAGEEHQGGMPQLNPDSFPSQLFWLAVLFTVFYILIAKMALPRVAEVLEERQSRIEQDLNKAEVLNAEAKEVAKAYEKTIEEARNQARALMVEAHEAITQQANERHQAFAAELDSRVSEAEQRIGAARNEALSAMRSMSAELVQATTQKLAGLEIAPEEAAAAVDAVMGEQ